MFVLATHSSIREASKEHSMYLADIISPQIPMSLDVRCLHYSHLVIGDTTLVVAYITDFYHPYHLTYYLNAHTKSSFSKFSRTSVILPVGTDFKVFFLFGRGGVHGKKFKCSLNRFRSTTTKVYSKRNV